MGQKQRLTHRGAVVQSVALVAWLLNTLVRPSVP